LPIGPDSPCTMNRAKAWLSLLLLIVVLVYIIVRECEFILFLLLLMIIKIDIDIMPVICYRSCSWRHLLGEETVSCLLWTRHNPPEIGSSSVQHNPRLHSRHFRWSLRHYSRWTARSDGHRRLPRWPSAVRERPGEFGLASVSGEPERPGEVVVGWIGPGVFHPFTDVTSSAGDVTASQSTSVQHDWQTTVACR